MVLLNNLEPPSFQSHFGLRKKNGPFKRLGATKSSIPFLFAKKWSFLKWLGLTKSFKKSQGFVFSYPTRELVSVFYPNRTHLNNYVLFDTFTVDVIACLKWLGLTKSFEESQGIVVCFLSNNYYHLKQLCFNTFTVDVIASLCPAQPLCVRPSNWDDANKFQWKWLVFVAPCIQG